MQGLLTELNRRNVFRVAIAYLVASWVVLQIVDVIVPILELPEWTAKLVFVILAVCLMPALVFAWAYEMTPDGLKREAEVTRDESIANKTAQKLNYTIIAVLVVAVGLLLMDREADEPELATEAPLANALPDQASSAASIAVLPFVNMSDDKDYFADGITEEILNALASVKKLKVAGRTSSFAFKGENDDLRRIGEALGVDHILEGSVRKSGDKVRITAQLIHVADGFHLWSETYDRELDDVFQVQDDISKEILNQLTNTLLAGVELSESKRTNPEAYELYLRAKQRIYTRDREALNLAVQDLNRAIDIDPEYAPAYAQLGIAAILLSERDYGTTPYDDAQRRGKRFVDIALGLDPNLAEAWAGLGLYEGRAGGDSEASIDALTRALELNPNMIDARNWLQIALRSIGEYRAAMEITKEIADTDPLYMPAFSNGIAQFIAFGKEELSREWIERLRKFDPDNPRVAFGEALIHGTNGRHAEAFLLFDQADDVNQIGGIHRIMHNLSMWNTGQYEMGLERGSEFWRPAYLSRLGREEEAFELARQQAVAGSPGNLIDLNTRAGRYKQVTDFIEERWPNLEVFASEFPPIEWGFSDMAMIALAYQSQGDERRFEEAMRLLDEWEASALEQGVSNSGLFMQQAQIRALRGDDKGAFDYLQKAIDSGWTDSEGIAQGTLILKRYAGDPRLAELEAIVLERVNHGRELLNMPLFDTNYQPIETDASQDSV